LEIGKHASIVKRYICALPNENVKATHIPLMQYRTWNCQDQNKTIDEKNEARGKSKIQLKIAISGSMLLLNLVFL
jgi:hypothetical protein